jgi:hypothetical protein
MNWRKWWLILISLFMVFTAKPCTNSAWGENYRIAFFFPFSVLNKHYQSLCFEFDQKSDPENIQGREMDRWRNCAEWKTHCGSSVKLTDIYQVLYNMPPGKFPEEQIKAIGRKKFYGNTFAWFLCKKANAEYASYMDFAKRVELYCSYNRDAWTEDIAEDKQYYDVYGEHVLEKLKKCKIPFLKKRLAFILVKQNNYGAMYEEVTDAARNYLQAHEEKSIIDYWAMYYWPAYEKDYVKNIYYARCIEGSAEKLVPSVKYFISAELGNSLKAEKNKSLRSNLYALYALNQPDRALQAIYKTYNENALNPLLSLLICREINKCEDWLLTQGVTGFESPTREVELPEKAERNEFINDTVIISDRVYARKLQALIYIIVNDPHVQEKSFWQLAAAHLAIVRGNAHMGKAYLDAYSQNPLPKLRDQFLVSSFLLRCITQREYDAKSEEEFAAVYNSIQFKQELKKQKNSLVAYVATGLKNEGKIHKAALLNSCLANWEMYFCYASRPYHEWFSQSWITFLTEYGNVQTADSLVNMFQNKNRSPFQKIILANILKEKNGMNLLREWTGSLYLREQAYEKAAFVLKDVESTYWQKSGWYDYSYYFNQNPFYAKADCNHQKSEADAVHYNKYTFALKAISLKNQLRKGGDKSEQAELKLANALFNMTTHGNSWVVSRNSWQAHDNGPWKNFGEEFFACKSAMEAYKALYKKAANSEVKATCCIMLSACNVYAANYYEENKIKSGFKPTNWYIDVFIRYYSHTQVYLDCLSKCAGPREFRNSFAVN